jgi:hypothetical protein
MNNDSVFTSLDALVATSKKFTGFVMPSRIAIQILTVSSKKDRTVAVNALRNLEAELRQFIRRSPKIFETQLVMLQYEVDAEFADKVARLLPGYAIKANAGLGWEPSLGFHQTVVNAFAWARAAQKVRNENKVRVKAAVLNHIRQGGFVQGNATL